MSRTKKVVAGVVVTALVIGAGAGGARYIKKANETEVLVVSVGSIASDFYSQNTYLDGNVTSNVSQSVYVDKDMVIQDVPVQKGDSVKKGDTLITFDMTLVEMELNIARLKKQQQEQDLKKAEKRLYSLQHGGPIVEEDDTLPRSGQDELISTGEGEEASAAVWRDNYLAAAVNPVILAAAVGNLFSDFDSETMDTENLQTAGDPDDGGNIQEDAGGVNGNDSLETPGSEFSSGEGNGSGSEFVSGENDPPRVTPTPTPKLEGDMDYLDPYPIEDNTGFHDGNPTFYQKLDGDSVPYTGRGSETEPFVFLCSAATGKVSVTGEFLNRMAGFSKDGTRVESDTAYWYQIEFHERDTITDFENRKESCIGYYLINGAVLGSPASGLAEVEFTVDDADKYEPEENPEEPEIPGDPGNNNDTVVTRKEAIKQKQSQIASLKLDIQESDINIAKLEKKVQKKIIYSKLDGVVAYVGDPLTGTSSGNAFIIVRSKDGYYVKGTVSELLLDEVKEGSLLNCSSYEKGNFEAEVVDVSDYPASSQYYGYGDGNPNVSYYTFSAMVTDDKIKLSESDWLQITLKNESAVKGSFVLDKAFVLSENGKSYAYKDDNGVLKKQLLTVGGNVNGGYSVLVKGGLTKDDKIAFPYAKSAQEGVKTREGTLDEMYGY